MEHLSFARWCETAVSGIRFQLDRAKVYDELYAHLEDSFEALTEAGTDKDEAEKRSLAAMGSAAEVAEQLEQIHRPFWGYVLRAARWLLVIAAVMALFTVPRWIAKQGISTEESMFPDIYFEHDDMEHGDLRGERVFYAEPMSRDFSDGYRFTLTKASEWHEEGTVEGREIDSYSFFLSVEVFNLRPWALYSDILREFYAVDSLGKRYEAYNKSYYGEDPTLAGNPVRTGLCTMIWELWLSEYCSHDAEWIELRYDQSGRDVRLRIDMTGGDAA